MNSLNCLPTFGIFIISLIALDVAANCAISAKKPFIIEPKNKYGLWPGLINPHDLNDGQTLSGFCEVFISINTVEILV